MQTFIPYVQSQQGSEPPPNNYPNWLKDVSATLPKHPTLRYEMRTAKVDTIAIHHSASPPDTSVEAIARYHVDSRGWPGIGYHLVVAADGTTYLTNDLSVRSYHVGNENDHAVGVCFAGDATKAPMTDAQITAGKRALSWLLERLALGAAAVKGHGDLPNQETSCPGGDWWKALLKDEPADDWPTTEEIGNFVRALLFPAGPIARNTDSAFFKQAQIHSLGMPLMHEADMGKWRVQSYALGTVVAVIGDWGNARVYPAP